MDVSIKNNANNGTVTIKGSEVARQFIRENDNGV